MSSEVEQSESSFGRNLQIGFWFLLVSITTYFGLISLEWQQAMLRNVLVIACHSINFYTCYSFLVPRFYEKKKYWTSLGGLILLYIVLSPIRYYIEDSFIIPNGLQSRFGMFGLTSFVIFTQIAISGFAMLLRLTVSHETTRQRVIMLQKAQLDAELKFLKAQMNPHFLFNTINNIYGLTLEKSEQAPEALMRLSGLLRYLLYESPGKVTLARELDALEAYAELFQLRYEEPLNLIITMDVRDRDNSCIEPHLLVPILENTLKHSGLGVDPKAYALFSILEDENNIWVEVENSRAVIPLAGARGIALANIGKRLQMVYPDRHTFKIQYDKDRFSVTLIVPKHTTSV